MHLSDLCVLQVCSVLQSFPWHLYDVHVCACKVTNQSTVPPANGMFINPP